MAKRSTSIRLSEKTREQSNELIKKIPEVKSFSDLIEYLVDEKCKQEEIKKENFKIGIHHEELKYIIMNSLQELVASEEKKREIENIVRDAERKFTKKDDNYFNYIS